MLKSKLILCLLMSITVQLHCVYHSTVCDAVQRSCPAHEPNNHFCFTNSFVARVAKEATSTPAVNIQVVESIFGKLNKIEIVC